MRRMGLRRWVDLYLAAIGAWAAAWARWRDRKGPLGMVNAWAFWLLAPALPVAAARLATARRGRQTRGPAAAGLALAAGLLLRRYRWPLNGLPRRAALPAEAAAERGATLRVLSFNILKENQNAGAVLAMIRREAPDVVLIQELEPEMNDRLQAGLEDFDHCEWYCHRRPGGSLGFFSRYPFAVTGAWDAPATRPYATRISLEGPNGQLDLYNVHLLSVSGKTLRKTGIAGNFRVREEQMAELAAEMNGGARPALALGDYNMTEGNQAYQVATAALCDAWLAAGRGPGWTWPRTAYPPGRPVLRLDYCFCNAGVWPVAMRVIDARLGSDHCPIVVDVTY